MDRLLHWKGMHPDLTVLNGIDELNRVLSASTAQPVLLFKHSYTCGVSAEALDELIAHLNERDHSVPFAMVAVQTHREVSNAIASRLGVRHETPQALLVQDGRVVWSASHFRVTSRSVEEAIRSRLS